MKNETLRFLSPLLFLGILHLDVCEQLNLAALGPAPPAGEALGSLVSVGSLPPSLALPHCQCLVPGLQHAGSRDSAGLVSAPGKDGLEPFSASVSLCLWGNPGTPPLEVGIPLFQRLPCRAVLM